jgi:hypothetical protein
LGEAVTMKKNNDDRKIPFLYIKIWVDALRAGCDLHMIPSQIREILA